MSSHTYSNRQYIFSSFLCVTSYPVYHNVSRLAHASCNKRSNSCLLVLRKPGEYTMRPLYKTVMSQRPGFNDPKITTLGLNQLIDCKHSHRTTYTHTHRRLNSPTSKHTWLNGTLARRRSSHTHTHISAWKLLSLSFTMQSNSSIQQLNDGFLLYSDITK